MPFYYSFAQSKVKCDLSLTGLVLNQSGGQPMSGVNVWVKEFGNGTVTDTEGRYTINGLCKGKYTLAYSFVGYKTTIQMADIQGSVVLEIVNLTDEDQKLEEVEIVEKKSESSQVIQTQSELSGKELETTRGQSLGESLKTITGLYSIQTGPGISKPVIHGLHSNRILILNNGVRQEGQQWGSEHAPEIDAFIATRFSVIKGAASIRYGSDAIGGVIMVEPKNLPVTPGIGGEINLVGMSNSKMSVASGILEGAFGKKLTGLSWRIQGTYKQAGYTKTPHYYLENTSYLERNFSTSVNYTHKNFGTEFFFSQFSTKIGLFTGAQVGSLKDLYEAISRSEPLSQPGFSYRLERPFQQVKHDLFKAKAYVNFENFGKISATFARQENKRFEYDYVPFNGSSNPELYLKLVSHTADLIWEHKPARGFSGSVGLNGITQANVRQFLFLIPNFRNYGGGVFAIERYVKNKWSLEAGIRYDYRWLRAYFLDEPTLTTFSKTNNWSNFTGSLGAVYQLNNHFEITANLSSAWRSPTVSELYSDGLHQSAVAYERGNPDLKPEQAYNANFSVEYTANNLSAEIGFYNNIISNYIYLKPDSLPVIKQRGAFPSYSYNQVNATFRGIDATIRYKITNRLTLTSKTSLLFAYDHTNRDYLVFIPPNRTDNGLRYEFSKTGKLKNLYLSLTTLYVAEQKRVPAVTQEQKDGTLIFKGDFAKPPPDYFLVGAEAGFSFNLKNQPVNVIFTGSNLLNHAYRDYMNRFRYYADEAGTNLAFKIKLPFSITNNH